MITIAQKHAAERDARALLEDHGLPQPDDVEYGAACVRLIWREEQLCLVVDIEEHSPAAIYTEDLADDRPSRSPAEASRSPAEAP